MAKAFSPTGYWAHYTTRWTKADGSPANSWTDSFPVVGYTDAALVINTDGRLLTVTALRDHLAEGGATPDEDGETFRVTFEVHPFDSEA